MKKRRALAVLLFLLAVFCIPVGALAASKKGITFDKYLNKGKNYMILLYNSSYEKGIPVYTKKDKKSRIFSWMGYGDAIVVDKSRIKKKKRYQWIPVKMQSSSNRYRTGYIDWKKRKMKEAKLFALYVRRFSSNITIDRAIKYGMNYLGTPFLLGGGSATGGIDCSHFVVQCYAAAGKTTSWPHTDGLQNVSYPVSKSRLRAGDLIFYRDVDPCQGNIGHVAIYIGSGFVLHASGHYGSYYPQGGVCIKRINYGKRIAAMYKRLNGF